MKSKTLRCYLSAFTILASLSQAHAEIREIKSMSEILPYVTTDTLLVFDLDNTVMEPIQTLGSDQWFKSLLAQGDSLAQALGLWEQVQKKTEMLPVEAITPKIIRSAQIAGNPVMALTARPADLEQVTEAQLRSIGVSFLRSPVSSEDQTDPSGSAPQYIRGIEFVGPKLSKGEALVQLLNRIGLRPNRVVFVDDTAKHTVTVNASLNAAGIENFEFRYGAADATVAAFNPEIVRVELQTFESNGTLISDAAAAAMK